MERYRSGEFSSFYVFLENYRKAVVRACATTEESLSELRRCWNSIDWNDHHGLEQIQRVLGIIINQLAQKDREMERYHHLLKKQFPHHKAHLIQVHTAMNRIHKEVRDESIVENEEHTIHGMLRDEEKRLSSMLKAAAVSLRRSNKPDHEAISVAYHLVEPILVQIEKHERALESAIDTLLLDERRAA